MEVRVVENVGALTVMFTSKQERSDGRHETHSL